jgi:hypothetical protein
MRAMAMMNEFEAQVLADLCVLKTHMTSLIGDGEHGRIDRIERKLEGHIRHEEHFWQRAKGFGAAFGVMVTVAQIAVRIWWKR